MEIPCLKKIIPGNNWVLRFCKDIVSICRLVDGVVAQLVERLVRNEKVSGSIPLGSTIQIAMPRLEQSSSLRCVSDSSVVASEKLIKQLHPVICFSNGQAVGVGKLRRAR